jgi:hypothetical protein
MSSPQKFVATFVLLLLACISSSAFASSETLTFRLNALGEVEAVITGLTHGLGCDGLGEDKSFDPSSVITITTDTVLIVSPAIPYGCFIPIQPPLTYQQIANLGHLSGAIYQIIWNEGVNSPPLRSISASLNMFALLTAPSMPAPTLSWWMTILLALSLFGISIAALRRRAAHSRVKN